MLKQIFVVIVYLIDHWAGRLFYWPAYLIGKTTGLKWVILSRINKPCLLEIRHLREEVQRLRYANALMRQELNRVKVKKLCLCKKLQIIYFKLRFGVSLSKISQYLPISRSSVINYLNQLQSGISNLVSRIRGYHNSPNRTPISIAGIIWDIHQDNPHWGRWKIALSIWKIGVYVAPSTVRNILNTPEPDYRKPDSGDKIKLRAINGKYPNHIWSIDLTTVYIFFRPLYILAVLDHYSRKVMTLTTTFHPTAEWVMDKIDKIVLNRGKPKHLISDYGTQFTANEFRRYIKTQKIYHRYARVSKANGNSKVERFFLSLKSELLNLFLFFSKAKVDRLVKEYLTYYNEHRPHEALDGQVPNDVYFLRPRDKPQKDAKVINGPIEKIVLGDGLLKSYRLRRIA